MTVEFSSLQKSRFADAGAVHLPASLDASASRGLIAALSGHAGDIWLYATPILHASEPSVQPGHRRVLQVDFTADELPGGLIWLGV
ncbi:hypothetical protein [Bradyrhizobium sp. SZCCHNRI1009]|uniref:hypothetical protein n=1 Tax=Bradyrhizobium TaxID=374 RepID=UPI0029163B6B|nr:hypothetical protein [Bradyrhizobium sp. SZCCHNRI1009]